MSGPDYTDAAGHEHWVRSFRPAVNRPHIAALQARNATEGIDWEALIEDEE